jgi:acetyl esterase/lipase
VPIIRCVIPAAALAALAVAAGPGPPAIAVHHAVPFADRGGVVLRMDVARPADAPRRARPAIVWVHGGGFHSGTRQRMEPYTRFFARRGWVAATIDYRLHTHAEVRSGGYGVGERDARDDALAAIAYLRRNAGALGVDPRRIVIAGASAGAITALDVATQAPGAVRAAAALAGYGHPADIDAGDPPLLLVHGDADAAIPFARAQETCAAARRAGARCDLVRVPGAGHRTLLGRLPANARLVAAWLRALRIG